jgi:hypothetical protein
VVVLLVAARSVQVEARSRMLGARLEIALLTRHLWCLNPPSNTSGASTIRGTEQTTDRRARRDTEDRIAEKRWLDEGGSFSRYPNQAEEIEMTDVRRSGPPRRLADQTRYGIPIEGEVDGLWQRAFHVHLAEQVRRQPDLTGAEFFEKSLTINPAEIKFRFVDSPSLLPAYLDMIESAIPQANQTAAVERQRLDAAVAEAERALRERDQDIEQALTSWAEQQPADR